MKHHVAVFLLYRPHEQASDEPTPLSVEHLEAISRHRWLFEVVRYAYGEVQVDGDGILLAF
jgi:hypothetical protein